MNDISSLTFVMYITIDSRNKTSIISFLIRSFLIYIICYIFLFLSISILSLETISCSNHITCGECVSDPSDKCGWCATSNTCQLIGSVEQKSCHIFKEKTCQGTYYRINWSIHPFVHPYLSSVSIISIYTCLSNNISIWKRSIYIFPSEYQPIPNLSFLIISN